MFIICQLKSKLNLSSVINFCIYICPKEKKSRKYIFFVLFYVFQNFGNKHVLSVQEKPEDESYPNTTPF